MADNDYPRMMGWEKEWDILFLGFGSRMRRMPGVARVEVHAPVDPDVQKAKGRKGAKIVDQGRPPAELLIEIEVVREEYDELRAAMAWLRPQGRTAGQRYLTIEHPAAAFYDVHQVMIGDMNSPQIAPGGTFFLQFTALEYIPQPAVVKKAKPAAAPAADDGSYTPEALQSMIDQLNKSPSKSGAAEKNFSAPEDVRDYSALASYADVP